MSKNIEGCNYICFSMFFNYFIYCVTSKVLCKSFKILIIGGKPVGEIPLKTMVANYKREQQLKNLDSPTNITVPAAA